MAAPASIESGQALGSPAVQKVVSPASFGPREAFGNVAVQNSVLPASIKSTQAFGNPTRSASASIAPSSIKSAQAFGNPAGAATTVFTLEPAFWPVMNNGWLRGSVQAGHPVVPINYFNWPDPWGINANTAMGLLDAALLAHPTGNLLVFGHSFGSQIACKWLREKGPTSTISPFRLSFILTGNPERRYGGTLGMLSGRTSQVQSPGWTGGVHSPPWNSYAINVIAGQNAGVPASNRYSVIDFARQYDYYADYPTVVNPSYDATSNVTTTVHASYWNVTLADAGNVSYGPENNVTYMWSPTRPTSKIANSWWLSAAQKTAQEAIYRPIIEAAYVRPVAIP